MFLRRSLSSSFSAAPCLDEIVGDGGVVVMQWRSPGQVHGAGGEGHDERTARHTRHICIGPAIHQDYPSFCSLYSSSHGLKKDMAVHRRKICHCPPIDVYEINFSEPSLAEKVVETVRLCPLLHLTLLMLSGLFEAGSSSLKCTVHVFE